MSGEDKKPETGGRPAGKPREKPAEEAQKTETAQPEQRLTIVERQRLQLGQRVRLLPAAEQVILNDEAESLTAALPPARRDQQRNQGLLDQAAKSAKADEDEENSFYVIRNGKMTRGPGTKDETPLQFPVVFYRYSKEGHSGAEAYNMLLDYGKNIKDNPAALKSFVADLIWYLNGYYDDRKKHAGVGSNQEILDQIMQGNKTVKNLICGPIAEFVVRFLNEIGVNAAVATGHMLAPGGKNTEHAIVVFKGGPGLYGFMGGTHDNIYVSAPNVEIALKNAFKVSQGMASSGYVTVIGVMDGKSYTRYMFNEEAAFGQDMDMFSDERVAASSTRFLNSIMTLDAQERANVMAQAQNARNAGLTLRSITVQGAQTSHMNPAGGAKVVFEGMKNGIRRIVTFDAVAARNQQRMTALWRMVGSADVETMALSLERKKTGVTDSFDSSSSYGVKGQYEQAHRSGAGTNIIAGELALNTLSGRSTTFTGLDKSSDFYSLMLAQDYRYVRSCVDEKNLRLSLWVGGGYMATMTRGQSEVKGIKDSLGGQGSGTVTKGPSERGTTPDTSNRQISDENWMRYSRNREDHSSSGFAGSLQAAVNAGAMISGRTDRLRYFSALSFSLFEEPGLSGMGKQSLAMQAGYRVGNVVGFAYNMGRRAYLDGQVNFVSIRMPAFEKDLAQYGIGVCVMDVGGVSGLDVRFDVGGQTVNENLNISTLGSETLRRETSVGASGKIHYQEGRNVYGIGLSGNRVADSVRRTTMDTAQVEATYSIVF